MPKKLKIGLFTALLAALFSACSGGGAAEPEQFLRLDRAVASGVMPDSVMAEGWSQMSAMMGGLSLEDYSSSVAVKVFQPDVERILPDLDSLQTVVGSVKESLRELLPELRWHRTYAMVWPYDQSVVYDAAAGNLYVALNQYLGENYPGYSGRYPQFLAENKRPAMLPADITEALLQSAFPYQAPADESSPLIYQMLHDGAVAYAMTRLLPPDTPLYAILGLSPDRVKWLQENEASVWRSMMEGQLVYNTDPALAARLLRRAPSSPMISAAAPGQTARFIGLRIVESYVNHNRETTIRQLLSPEFYNSTQSLIHSKYAPN